MISVPLNILLPVINFVCNYVANLQYMYNVLFVFTAINVSVVSIPNGYPVIGANNTYEYFYGTNIRLTCSVTPVSLLSPAFSWSCSTGCFADRRRTVQSISVYSLDEADSGVLNCSVIINGIKYFSEPFHLQVISGMYAINILNK